jgi:REP element-mobilizing transposase RayT
LSLHTEHSEINEVYFCTVTCYKWFSLFEQAQAYNSVYRWFDYLKNDGCLLIGFVIMPNHFHVLLYPTHSGTSLSKIVGDGKRFMAYDIVNALKKSGQDQVLQLLKDGVEAKEKLKGKKHQVFRLSFDARKCFSEKVIEQKLEYMHHNPVQGKWNLADDFTKYIHSSARFYELGELGRAPLFHYKDLGNDNALPLKTSTSSVE